MLRLPTAAFLAASLFAIVGPASAQIVLGGKPVDDPNAPKPSPVIIGATAGNGALLDLDAPDFKPLAIAVPAFTASTDAEKQLAAKIVDLVNKDLTDSGDFKSLDPATFGAETVDVGVAPVYANWAGFGAQTLVVGKVIANRSGSIRVQFRVFETATGKQLIGTEYMMPATEAWSRLAHKIADDIYYKTTGQPGYFDTRIVYVAEPGPKSKLGLIDQGGGNATFPLSDVPSLQSPHFSPSSSSGSIVYSVDVPQKTGDAKTTTALFDLATGRRESLVPGTPQPNPDARFSPGGRTIVFSRTETRSPDLFVFDLAKRTETQLTKTPDSEAAPSVSADGSKLAYVTPNDLMVSNADGQQARSIASGAFKNPVWSPTGDWIAFEADGKIGVMKSDGGGKKLLTQGPADTSPTWSPNGRVLAFARKDGAGSKLWTVEVSGRNLRQLPTPGSAAQPDWGPKLP